MQIGQASGDLRPEFRVLDFTSIAQPVDTPCENLGPTIAKLIFDGEGLAPQVASGLRSHRCDSNYLPNISPALRESKIRRASNG